MNNVSQVGISLDVVLVGLQMADSYCTSEYQVSYYQTANPAMTERWYKLSVI